MTKSVATTAQIGIILTCEHATEKIPEELREVFKGKRSLLRSHRGWDSGALDAAKELKLRLGSSLISAKISRLAIDHNRSLGTKDLHHYLVGALSKDKQTRLIEGYYKPFRETVNTLIREELRTKKHVVHFSIHSFTPVLKGKRRNGSLGLLFDPSRSSEAHFVALMTKSMRREFPRLKIRNNYPYKGTSDGHTTSLRKQFSKSKYSGIEIEFNQAFLKRLRNNGSLGAFSEKLSISIREAIANFKL